MVGLRRGSSAVPAVLLAVVAGVLLLGLPARGRKACPDGCLTYGTCNEELGRCGGAAGGCAALDLVCGRWNTARPLPHFAPSTPARPRCDCPWNYTGPACQEHFAGFCVKRLGVDNPINTCKDGHPSLCVNACNGRGDCKGGFCHCKPGEGGGIGSRRGGRLLKPCCGGQSAFGPPHACTQPRPLARPACHVPHATRTSRVLRHGLCAVLQQ